MNRISFGKEEARTSAESPRRSKKGRMSCFLQRWGEGDTSINDPFFHGKMRINHQDHHWLVVTGTMEWIMTFHILAMSSSQLTNSMIFQRGRSTTNQIKWLGVFSMFSPESFIPNLFTAGETAQKLCERARRRVSAVDAVCCPWILVFFLGG